MRIFLAGGSGQLGRELRRSLSVLGELAVPSSAQLDLRDGQAVRQALQAFRPDVVVNAAAYTDVEAAETDAAAAFLMNRDLPAVLAQACAQSGALLLQFSTDYVFDGKKAGPYVEDDAAAPLNVYGQSKLAGEQALMARQGRYLIVRTGWIYGGSGRNFLLTMQHALQSRKEVRVVADQHGAPTWSRLVAEASAHLVLRYARQAAVQEVFHLGCAGACSWYDFAEAIARRLAAENIPVARLLPIASADYASPVRRPANSRLSCNYLQTRTGLMLPDWQQALALCLEDESLRAAGVRSQ